MSPLDRARRWLRYCLWVLRYRLFRLFKLVVPWLSLVVLYLLAVRERRRPRQAKPRLFWGKVPLISIRYHSLAMRRLGYESTTVVNALYFINPREDFDVLTSELVDRLPFARWLPPAVRLTLEPYVTFAWALRNFDVFTLYATGRILVTTPLSYRELELLHRAGKKVVLLAYGGDVQVMSRFRNLPFKHAMCMDYPEFARLEAETLRNMEYCVAQADHVVSGVDWVDYMPRWDTLNAGHFAIDTAEFTPAPAPAEDDSERPIVVFHAPNHRELKGTRFLIAACEELKAEGEPIELRLVENVPNTEVRRQLAEADIVADQFIVGWYAFFAIEAMAMAKPVLCYLRPDLVELYTLYSFAAECPLVNTSPFEIKERLRELIHDARRRRELGLAGRRYVEDHHSLKAVGAWLDEIYRSLWPNPSDTSAIAPP
jgi:glycosyltransferase involved in cell wall biosynthesis